MANITGKFDWQFPKDIPSFIQGTDAKAIYDLTEGIRTGEMVYNPQTELFYGSTPFLASRVDTIVRPLGLRVASLRDLTSPIITRMIKKNCYSDLRFFSDSPTFVVRSEKDSYSKNNPLIRLLLEEASKHHEKLPFMVTGFDSVPWLEDEEGYGIKIVPRNDFRIIHDERLDGKYLGKTFTEVDEIGLPKFDENGNRIWFTNNKGLSRVRLIPLLHLDLSMEEDLASSTPNGKIIIIYNAEEAAQHSLREHLTKLQQNLADANAYNQGVVDEAIARLRR